MKMSKEELTKLLKEETERFKKEPDDKYIKLLKNDVSNKSSELKNKLDKKMNEIKNDKKETVYVLEEILEQLEKIYSIL